MSLLAPVANRWATPKKKSWFAGARSLIERNGEGMTYALNYGEPDKTISPDDGMFHGNIEHYLSCGESALGVILATIILAGVETPKQILDFGAGAGRVTRWLRAAFPEAKIHACDIRDQDMTFLRSSFGVEAWTVGTNLELITIPGQYDLIWVGSVITHLPKDKTLRLIKKLFPACNPGGLLVVSFHGQYVIDRQDTTDFRYIHDKGWQEIKSGYLASGYGYADYEGQSDYGISVFSPSWIVGLAAGTLRSRLVLLSERAWDNHHDVIAFQKTD
jgi:SAM-dependent methyltransferase